MQEHDVVGIGNAIVDIIARCDEGFLSKHDLAKGFMRLIDADDANRLYEAMGPAVELREQDADREASAARRTPLATKLIEAPSRSTQRPLEEGRGVRTSDEPTSSRGARLAKATVPAANPAVNAP